MVNLVDTFMAKIAADRKAASEKAETERNVLVIAMLQAGVAKVTIDFAGSGDSGNIDDIEVDMVPGHEEPTDLKKTLEGWADTFLEGTGVDWYNNDGGQGSLNFDLTTVPPRFWGNIDCNEVVSETVQTWDEGAIEDPEEEA